MGCSRGQDNGNDHAVESDDFCENEDQDHANENLFLNSVCTNASIADNSDCESRSLGK